MFTAPPLETVKASLWKAAAVATSASAVTLLVTLARSKVTATLLGPEGLGVMAEVTQVATLVLVPLAALSGAAFVHALAQSGAEPKTRQRVFDVTLSAMLVAGSLLALLAFSIASWLFASSELRWFVLLAAFGALLTTVTMLPAQVLLATGQSHRYSLFAVVAALVSGASIVVGTFLAGLQGQFLAVCASPLLFLAVVYSFYRRTLPELRLRPQLRFDAALLRSSVSVGAAAVISTFAMQLSLSATRVALNAHGGAEANGQFQAAWSIESAYLMVVLQGLSTVVFPRYASAKDSRELQTEVNTAVDLVFRVVPPLILTVMAFRELAVHILFSDRFDVAAKIVGFQMVGDFAKVLAWVQAGPLLYRGKVKAFLFTEGAATLLLVVLPPVLVMHFGTVGACAGFGIAYLVYVAITRVALRTACEVVVPWRMTLATMGFGGVLLGLLVLADATLWFRLTLLLAAGIWAWRARVWRLGRRPA